MMIMRIGHAVVLALSLLVAPLAVAGQPTGKVPRVGWLVTGSPTTHGISLEAFREGLRSLGYLEGRNIHIEYRWAEGNVDRLPELAAELVRLNVDVILAGGGTGVLAAKNATRTIPIVMAGVGEPVESGFVTSLARPGGNITGFGTLSSTDMPAKQLEILREIVPRMQRAAALWNPTNPGTRLSWEAVHKAASALRITLISYEARNIGELESTLVTISKARPDGLIVLNDPFVFSFRKNIVEFAAQARLPAVYGFSEFVTTGGLISYGTNISETYRRAATYVDRILKGANPGDLPVELPTKFDMALNLKTSKALRLTIPPSLLLRADQVIK
jgi:putative tryptophan/tyrosine transport system substrate-binding protein